MNSQCRVSEMERIFAARACVAAMGMILVLGGTACPKNKENATLFRYAGGTEQLSDGCPGRLMLTSQSMTFQCPDGSITAGYSSIRLMQYRPDISREVRKMKVRWRVLPLGASGGRHNRYFTVVFTKAGRASIMILRVEPEEMRPYLAEIELKSGRRIQVWEREIYDE
jgi:hypothetical protein